MMVNTETLAISHIDQLLESSLLSDIEFVQKGSIDAFSSAFASDVNPRLSFGVTVNVYLDGSSHGNPIESSLIADYEGFSDSYAEITDIRDTETLAAWVGEVYAGNPQDPRTDPVSGGFSHNYTNEKISVQQNLYAVEGRYQEHNRTDQFYGFNATLGTLWTVSDRLTLGAAIDLPWTGHGKQTKRIYHQTTAINSNQVQVAQKEYSETQKRDAEYTFPLYWAVWRWNDHCYSFMDVSRTHWSDYSYKAEGEERINPLNGEPATASDIDDCWAVRFGSEYLCVLSWTEIPLRGGLFWEQRPAIGSPDEYWGFSLGSGFSLGKEPGRLVLDFAYSFERGENVMGSLLPGQGMTSDATKHQLFISAIWNF